MPASPLPAQAWRDAVGEHCDQCRGLLAFMEGPLCDLCLDADERTVPPGFDVYVDIRNREAVTPVSHVRVIEAVRPSVGRDSLAVNLETGEVILSRARRTAAEKLDEALAEIRANAL